MNLYFIRISVFIWLAAIYCAVSASMKLSIEFRWFTFGLEKNFLEKGRYDILSLSGYILRYLFEHCILYVTNFCNEKRVSSDNGTRIQTITHCMSMYCGIYQCAYAHDDSSIYYYYYMLYVSVSQFFIYVYCVVYIYIFLLYCCNTGRIYFKQIVHWRPWQHTLHIRTSTYI